MAASMRNALRTDELFANPNAATPVLGSNPNNLGTSPAAWGQIHPGMTTGDMVGLLPGDGKTQPWNPNTPNGPMPGYKRDFNAVPPSGSSETGPLRCQARIQAPNPNPKIPPNASSKQNNAVIECSTAQGTPLGKWNPAKQTFITPHSQADFDNTAIRLTDP